MKKILLIAASLLLLPLFCNAQEEDITTTWPYLYQDFQDGTIYMKGGQKLVQKLNVHVGHSELHFIDKDVVRRAVLKDVLVVEIGSDSYMNYENSMLKVTAKNDKGFIGVLRTGDFAALAESGGAYGTSSSTSATMKLSSIDTGNTLGMNHMLLLQNKHDGKSLDLITKYYIVTPEFSCQATKKELDKAFADRAAEWKAFLKANKIRWNNPESLAVILDFLN